MACVTVERLDDLEAVSQRGAEAFVRIAGKAIAARGRFAVALAGGSTPRRTYELLARPPFAERIDWSRGHYFWGDERAVLPSHPDSNFHMANEAMLRPLGVPRARIHRMEAERDDLDKAATDHQAEIARVLGVPPDGEPPRLDLVLLGLGADAHCASLFPGTQALREKARWVAPNRVPAPTASRITLTPPILNRAACVIFLVAGADKASALAAVIEGPRDPDRFPAQLICLARGNVLWLVDRAAASKLTSGHDGARAEERTR